jgi:phosphate-selective porin OprO/OprP
MLLDALLLLQQGATLAPENPLSWLPGKPSEKTVKVIGRFQTDFVFVTGGEDSEAALGETFMDGSEVRRARLGVEGAFTDEVKYKFEMDFAGGTAAPTDMFLQLAGPVGNWRVGHFKEPFSLEEQTSSRFITFLERNAVNEAFAPARNAGLSLSDFDNSMTWAAGIFRDVDKTGKSVSEAWSATGRFVYRPWYEEEGRRLLHLAVAASLRSPDGEVGFDASPEVHLGLPDFFGADVADADRITLLGIEAAFQEGPFHGQFEWQSADVSGPTGSPEPSFDGLSVQAGWFLTGESRGYKAEAGAWDRVKTETNAFAEGGLGAWEVAARFSTLDLTEGGAADDLNVISIALNWYLNDYTRVMLDVIRPELDAADDTTVVALRAAFDF